MSGDEYPYCWIDKKLCTLFLDGGITALFMAAMYTQNIKKMVAHAANSYFEDEDIDMILKGSTISKTTFILAPTLYFHLLLLKLFQ